MHDRDNFDLSGRNLINDAIRILVNFTKGLLGIFMDRVSLCRMYGHLLNTLNDTCDHPGGVIFRITGNEPLDGAEIFACLSRPDDFHTTPSSLRIASWEWTRPARKSAKPASIFWRT